MKDLIDREALALDVRRNLMPNVDADGTVSVEDAERYFLSRIENVPAVDAVEVVHGRWEEYQVPHIICCSVCDWGTGVDEKHFNYCPNCGARMDGAE